MRSIRYLIVPGWHGSSDEHWQSHWHRTLPGSARVEQQDWLAPRREDWVAELQRSIAASVEPVILVADRKSTRLNSSHVVISYAVFCLKKKTTPQHT